MQDGAYFNILHTMTYKQVLENSSTRTQKVK